MNQTIDWSIRLALNQSINQSIDKSIIQIVVSLAVGQSVSQLIIHLSDTKPVSQRVYSLLVGRRETQTPTQTKKDKK